jgi:hypothetical protein
LIKPVSEIIGNIPFGAFVNSSGFIYFLAKIIGEGQICLWGACSTQELLSAFSRLMSLCRQFSFLFGMLPLRHEWVLSRYQTHPYLIYNELETFSAHTLARLLWNRSHWILLNPIALPRLHFSGVYNVRFRLLQKANTQFFPANLAVLLNLCSILFLSANSYAKLMSCYLVSHRISCMAPSNGLPVAVPAQE